MKSKTVLMALALTTALSACATAPSALAAPAPAVSSAAAKAKALSFSSPSMLSSYYAAKDTKPARMIQKKIFTKNLTDWVNTDMDKKMAQAVYDFDSFTSYRVLDSDLAPVDGYEDLYASAFSAKDGRQGYILLRYDPSGPALSRVEVAETPYPFDLQANFSAICGKLALTKLDPGTAQAQRIRLLDEKGEGREAILFTDGKNSRYVYFFADKSLVNYGK